MFEAINLSELELCKCDLSHHIFHWKYRHRSYRSGMKYRTIGGLLWKFNFYFSKDNFEIERIDDRIRLSDLTILRVSPVDASGSIRVGA